MTQSPEAKNLAAEDLAAVVDEYLHWRKTNKHIKGGGNYLTRLRMALANLTKQGE